VEFHYPEVERNNSYVHRCCFPRRSTSFVTRWMNRWHRRLMQNWPYKTRIRANNAQFLRGGNDFIY